MQDTPKDRCLRTLAGIGGFIAAGLAGMAAFSFSPAAVAIGIGLGGLGVGLMALHGYKETRNSTHCAPRVFLA